MIELLWWLPTAGDGRYVGTTIGSREITFPYLRQIAETIDMLGYDGVLVPTGRICEDPWVISSALIPLTQRLKFLIAVRPSVMSPTVAARMIASFDRISQGRLLLNVVTGGIPDELEADGVFYEHDERYTVTEKFLTAVCAMLQGEEVTIEDKHLHLKQGKILFPPVQRPYPPIYFAGASDAAHLIGAKHADVYMMWSEPLEHVEKRIKQIKKLAAAQGREIKLGIRFHIIVRETEQEAWQAAHSLIRHVDMDTISGVSNIKQKYDSEGQRRLDQRMEESKSLIVGPNLWAGICKVRSGGGFALVGNPEQIAMRLKEYYQLGISTFLISGYPHLEEAYRIAELLFPLLPLQKNGHNTDTAQGILGKEIAWF